MSDRQRSSRHRLHRFIATMGAATLLALPFAASTTASAQSGSSVAVHADASLGQILTDPSGRTLYLFTKDSPGVSTCYDQCAAAWPPLLTRSDPVTQAGLEGILGSTIRTDGSRQVTYNGMPLYYWVKDAQPGDTTGQNVGGVWFVVNPAQANTVTVRQDPDLGTILIDAQGMTLYTFTKDEAGTSNCYGECATAWPPLRVDATPTGPDAVAAGLGTTARTDGSQQVTYNNMPLYYWFKDARAGDTTGQNVGGVWFVVNP